MFDKKIIGLDISDYSIEALEISKNFFNKVKIDGYSRMTIEDGLVINGKIIDVAKVASKIKDLLQSAKPKAISANNLALSLPSSQVYVGIINLPNKLNKAQLEQVVYHQAPEIFPLDQNKVVSAWQILKTSETEHEILIAAVSKDLFDQYLDLGKKLNKKIISIEIEATATARAVLPKIKNNEGCLLIDIGARTTNISIFDDIGLRSLYNINIAGNNFTKAIAEKHKISLAEAEKLKVRTGLSNAQGEDDLLLIIQSYLQKIIPEIKKSIDYFENKYHKTVASGLLTGGSSLLPGMLNYFKDNLKLELRLANSLIKIQKNANLLNEKDSVLYSNVVGLAFKEQVQSNKKVINFIK